MNKENLIPIEKLCVLYSVDIAFFLNLNEIGLIEIISLQQTDYIDETRITDIEKILRIHHELDINIEGIDAVFNLLQKIDELQIEVVALTNRLRLFEN